MGLNGMGEGGGQKDLRGGGGGGGGAGFCVCRMGCCIWFGASGGGVWR